MGTYRQAQKVQASADQAKALLQAKDYKGLAADLPDLAEQARELDAQTSAVPWTVLTWIPRVGSSAVAVRTVASATAEMATAAEPVATMGVRLLNDGVKRADGSVDVDMLKAAGPSLTALSQAVDRSFDRVAAIDTATLVDQLKGPVTTLREALASASPVANDVASIAQHLPGLAGADGPRTWAVLMQNNAELRGTGGIVGAYAIVGADDGRVTLKEAQARKDGLTSAIPTAGAPKENRDHWTTFLSDWASYNYSPHFPLTAELTAAGMKARGTPVDGVIGIDASVVAAILAGTGPVSAEGVTITPDNAVDFFTRQIYEQFPDVADKDRVTVCLLEATFAALLANKLDLPAMVEALREPVRQDRLKVWSAVPAEEEWLDVSAVGGVLPDTAGPVVAVSLNSGSTGKVDAYVNAAVDYAVGKCPTSMTQSSSVSLSLENNAPATLPAYVDQRGDDPSAPKGSTKLYVHVYGPVGATFESATMNGKTQEVFVTQERNRPVWWLPVELLRGDKKTLDVHFSEPTTLGVEPRVVPQAMATGEQVSITPNLECPSL